MDPIRPDPSQLLIETLSSVGGGARKRSEQRGAAASAPSLRDALRSVVVGVDPDDAASLLRARGPMLRIILASQLGGEVTSDPLHGELLARLEADMAAHPALDDMLRNAVLALKGR